MAEFNFPTSDELVNRMRTDVKNGLPGSNPFLTWLNALIVALALRFDENYTQLQTVYNSLFLPTSTDEFLDSWGSLYGVSRKPATSSTGNIVMTGLVGTSIPQGTVLSDSTGNQYETQTTAVIASQTYSVTLTRSGNVVTATAASADQFASGQTVTIAGADQTEYNGDFIISENTETEFTYEIEGTPTTPATGSITASADQAYPLVNSTDTGSSTNLENGEVLTLNNAIAGIDNTALVGLNGLTGGGDIEDDDSYRDRLLSRVQNPVANFSVSQIEAIVLEVNGVTRVWVQPTTPAIGSVTIFFVRDNDTDIIPNSQEIQDVTDYLEAANITPSTTDFDTQVIVNAPTPITVDFTFTALSPDSSTMRTAIEANLQQYFTERAGVGDDIVENGYKSAIYNTIDPDTGDQVTSFTLSAPVGDLVIATDEIGVLGNVSF